MKSILKKDRILVFVALLGLLASLAPLAARTKAEQSNRYYDYILDYSSLRYMASQSTRSEGEWLDRFASLGIDKATVAEATALGLNGSAGIPIHAMTVKDAMGDFGWESSYPDEVIGWMRESKDVSDAIICTDTAEAFDCPRGEFYRQDLPRRGKGLYLPFPAARRSEGRRAAEAAPWHLAGHHGAA